VRIPVSKLTETAFTLSDRAFRVLVAIESHARKDDVCFACTATLARESGRSLRSVQEAIVELIKAGHVVRSTMDSGMPCLRTIRRISLREQPLDFEDVSTDGSAEIRVNERGNPRHKYYEENNKVSESNSEDSRRTGKTPGGRTLAKSILSTRILSSVGDSLDDDAEAEWPHEPEGPIVLPVRRAAFP
jgi:hypothetical protein